MTRTAPLKAFLLCAGKGRRFDPHTRALPKVLLPFLNLPLAVYNMYLLKILGVEEWISNIHVHPALLKKELTFKAGMMGMKKPSFSYEQKLLGSAGGLLKVKNFFSEEEPFFYLNGDSFIYLDREEDLRDFYEGHLKSKALASFLVRPSAQSQGVIWAEEPTGEIASFLKKPLLEKPSVKAYDFSGLALFKGKIFKEISPGDFHIFKDLLEDFRKKSSLRVHSVSSLKLLNMNQESTYLSAVSKALFFLKKERARGGGFLHNILNLGSPGWRDFEGENYFSASPFSAPPLSEKSLLFCGKKVSGLEKISFKNFAVLGDHCRFHSPLCLEEVVLGKGLSLRKSVRKRLLLKGSLSS